MHKVKRWQRRLQRMDRQLKTATTEEFNFEEAESQLKKRKPQRPGTELNANKLQF